MGKDAIALPVLLKSELVIMRGKVHRSRKNLCEEIESVATGKNKILSREIRWLSEVAKLSPSNPSEILKFQKDEFNIVFKLRAIWPHFQTLGDSGRVDKIK
jgi:hypothetical protein